MNKSFYGYCVETDKRYLLDQWHPILNGELTPEKISCISRKKVWWRCEHGHEWQTVVRVRTNGGACPVCVNRKVQPGVNDLATTYPQIAAQWHPAKNGDLTPDKVFAGSKRKVWWVCEKGHEWQALINNRKQGCGCPVCACNREIPEEDSLECQFPQIAAQWDYEKNSEHTPQTISAFSGRKVWWICENGHEYETRVRFRTKAAEGCPYCVGRKVLAGFNDLATKFPKIADQWHPELNGDLTPEMVTSGSDKKVWWQCQYGHVWQAAIYSRTGKGKHGCPVCAGNINKKRRDYYAAMMDETNR